MDEKPTYTVTPQEQALAPKWAGPRKLVAHGYLSVQTGEPFQQLLLCLGMACADEKTTADAWVEALLETANEEGGLYAVIENEKTVDERAESEAACKELRVLKIGSKYEPLVATRCGSNTRSIVKALEELQAHVSIILSAAEGQAQVTR